MLELVQVVQFLEFCSDAQLLKGSMILTAIRDQCVYESKIPNSGKIGSDRVLFDGASVLDRHVGFDNEVGDINVLNSLLKCSLVVVLWCCGRCRELGRPYQG